MRIFLTAKINLRLLQKFSRLYLTNQNAETAINAYNPTIQQGDISGQKIDYNDWHQREKVWDALRIDDKKNIFYAALV
jgi:hypothetical protein